MPQLVDLWRRGEGLEKAAWLGDWFVGAIFDSLCGAVSDTGLREKIVWMETEGCESFCLNW